MYILTYSTVHKYKMWKLKLALKDGISVEKHN